MSLHDCQTAAATSASTTVSMGDYKLDANNGWPAGCFKRIDTGAFYFNKQGTSGTPTQASLRRICGFAAIDSGAEIGSTRTTTTTVIGLGPNEDLLNPSRGNSTTSSSLPPTQPETETLSSFAAEALNLFSSIYIERKGAQAQEHSELPKQFVSAEGMLSAVILPSSQVLMRPLKVWHIASFRVCSSPPPPPQRTIQSFVLQLGDIPFLRVVETGQTRRLQIESKPCCLIGLANLA